MNAKKITAATISAVAVFALAACSDNDDDDEPTPTPTVTVTEHPDVQRIDLVCPPPIGNVKVLTDINDQWAPAYVIGGDIPILFPVAFGDITVTNTETGEATVVDEATTKPGADQANAVECSFSFPQEVTEGPGAPYTGVVTGIVRATHP